jgi:H+/gluconate symporter-like permease
MAGIVAVILPLGLLILLAYRGVSVLIIAPLAALLAVLLSGDLPVLATYTQIFMPAVGGFLIQYFPLFLLGAIFGKAMEDSGSARAMSSWVVARLGEQHAVLAVVIACAVLTYGGVSLFVVAFAVFPIASGLFRQAGIPRRLIPATIALGAFTFTMTALPGTPAIQNAIPMPFFGTTPFAAPGLGILTGAVMFTLGLLWLNWRVGRARGDGEGYGTAEERRFQRTQSLREHALGEGFDIFEVAEEKEAAPAMPPVGVAVAPLVLVIALNLAFVALIIPAWDTGYLAEPQFGATSIASVRGLWAIIAALVISILVLVLLNYRRFANVKETLGSGADASVLPILNTASQVGFGVVIASLPVFEVIRDAVLNIGGQNPLISLAVSVNLLAGITGSASGGMSIALETLGDSFVAMAQETGISLELMHRVTAVATGGLDALPHNGAVITLLAICGLSHRESYLDILVVAVLMPLVALVTLIVLGSVFGSF